MGERWLGMPAIIPAHSNFSATDDCCQLPRRLARYLYFRDNQAKAALENAGN